MAMSTRRWGVKRRSTVNDSSSGMTSQPLAKPSTSTGSPRASPSTVAVQPGLKLCPSTSQNGSPGVAPVTSTVARSWSSSTTSTGAGGTGRRWPASATSVPAPAGVTPPPAAGPQHQPSRSPARRRGRRRSRCRARRRRAPARRRRRRSPPAAGGQGVVHGPADPHGTGWPSTVSRSLRQPRVVGVGQGRDGRPRQADLGDGGGLVDLAVADPVLGRDGRPGDAQPERRPGHRPGQRQVDRGGGVLGRRRPATGQAEAPWGTPSTISSTSVGTEWRPSATTVSGSESTVTGWGG